MHASPLAALGAGALLLVPATAAAQGSATYEVRFDATWSAQTHPPAFPPAAHFSGLIGGVHDASASLWQPGGLASPGIEQMAETGGTGPLTGEVQALISAGSASQVIQGGGLFSLPSSVTTTFTVTDTHPLVSLTTMIAPSPDWFLGVHDLALHENGAWVDDLVVPLFAWDAGTDSGADFLSGDVDTNPQEPISLITGGPFLGTTPLGTFTFTRQESHLVYGSALNPSGSIALAAGEPVLGATMTVRLDDPTGAFPQSAASALGLSLSSGGGVIPGFGLAGPAVPGEVLIGTPFSILLGPTYLGSPVDLSVPVPNQPGLVGLEVYLQGALIALGSGETGLTQALALRIG